MQTVSDFMSTDVRTMPKNAYVADISGIFIRDGIGGAPIVDSDGIILGFVSKTDVIRFESTGDDPAYARLVEIANRNVITISAEDSIQKAAQLMLHENVHHLVVEDAGKVAGIVSAFDFVRLVASEDSTPERNSNSRFPDQANSASGQSGPR